jgi:uncharacterized membrane-anchored protein
VSAVRHPPSSIRAELGWLALWFAIFIIIVVLMLHFVVPHHFNDRVAIMIAAILAGLAMIGLRAYVSGRA